MNLDSLAKKISEMLENEAEKNNISLQIRSMYGKNKNERVLWVSRSGVEYTQAQGEVRIRESKSMLTLEVSHPGLHNTVEIIKKSFKDTKEGKKEDRALKFFSPIAKRLITDFEVVDRRAAAEFEKKKAEEEEYKTSLSHHMG